MNIAICGSAPSSAHLLPVKDASYKAFTRGSQHAYPPKPFINDNWEIWGCSPGLFGVAERVDRWFEVHRWEPGKTWFSPEYCQWLANFNGPVYTGRQVEDIPNHVVYPLDRVEDEFGAYFLTSSLALMFALAILEIEDDRAKRHAELERRMAAEKARLEAMTPQDRAAAQQNGYAMAPAVQDTIGLFGVDMSAGEEWEWQRPGCQHFILEALRRGIRIYVPQESDILRPMPVYGISEWDDNYVKATARAKELNTRIQGHNAQQAEGANMAQYLRGAVDNMNYFIKTWLSPYGLPAGVFISQKPGTGMGGGTTMMDEPKPGIAESLMPSELNPAEPPPARVPKRKAAHKMKAKKRR